MCAVVGMVGGSEAEAVAGARAMAHRGPDAEGCFESEGVVLAHRRLAIRDLDRRSDQPFLRGRLALSYNGELWNAEEIRARLGSIGAVLTTTGDTEVVAAALEQWGDGALPLLEGMFAMAWTCGDGALRLAVDRHGEIPLHWSRDLNSGRIWAASETKGLMAMRARGDQVLMEPGTMVVARPRGVEVRSWCRVGAEPFSAAELGEGTIDPDKLLRDQLRAACEERAVSDVPVCALLSGGIDSAAVAAHLRSAVPGLVCYVAVMDERSRDLRCARAAAAHLGLELREVRVSPPTAEDLRRVVRAIEMPHKAQVEIGWPCVVLAERIRQDGHKVVFSGEGADELFGSYGMSWHGIKAEGWHEHRRRVFLEQHRKNFARVNKVFLSAGVEPRMPFLRRQLVELCLRLPQEAVAERGHPKAIMRRAHAGMLPPEILNRPKLAFQSGLGMQRAAAEAVRRPEEFYAREHERWRRAGRQQELAGAFA